MGGLFSVPSSHLHSQTPAKAGLLSLSTTVPAGRRVLQESREVLWLGIQTQEEDATY